MNNNFPQLVNNEVCETSPILPFRDGVVVEFLELIFHQYLAKGGCYEKNRLVSKYCAHDSTQVTSSSS